MPPRALLTGVLTVGLVTVPIRLYTATRSEALVFHLLHGRCGSRIQNHAFCPVCGVGVRRDELARGVEVAPDEYIRFTEAELKAFETQDGGGIEVWEFVPLDAVDPVYFDRTYYLGPGKGGEPGYQLLREAMAQRRRVALATYTMRGKQHLVLLRPVGEGFYLHTLNHVDEVTDFGEVERPDVTVRPGELDLAVRLIEDLAHPDFQPAKYADEYQQRVRAAVAHKHAGGTLEASEPPAPAPTTDLRATLQKSLDARRPLAGDPAEAPSTAASSQKRRRAS